MGSTIRARFSGGALKPMEALALKEGGGGHNYNCLFILAITIRLAGTYRWWVDSLVDAEEIK